MKVLGAICSRIKEYILTVKCGGKANYTLECLRKKGAIIGDKVRLYSNDIFIDPSRPWLLKIGAYTKITHHVVILTHDYSLSVMRRKYGIWIGEGKETVIGTNCFIGMGAIILMGTHIGDNCIVGAGSVVKGRFPDDVVIAGNPAKIICSLDEHYKRRKEKTIEEAKECARVYKERFGRIPTPKELEGFKFLFMEREAARIEEENLSFNCTGDEPSEVEEAFYNSEPYWNSYSDFIKETFQS